MKKTWLAAGERLLSRAAHALEHHPKHITALIAAVMLCGGGGAFAVGAATAVVVDADHEEVARTAEWFASILRPSTGFPIPVTRGAAVTPPRVDAVDTTGAGDTFCGAFAAAVAEGRDLADAARFATAASALSVERVGAVSSIPPRAIIEAKLEEQW